MAGLVVAARLGAWSLPLAVVTFLLLLPIFPASHDNLPRQGRYLMPLLPLAFAGAVGWRRCSGGAAPVRAPSTARRGHFGRSLALSCCCRWFRLTRYERGRRWPQTRRTIATS